MRDMLSNTEFIVQNTTINTTDLVQDMAVVKIKHLMTNSYVCTLPKAKEG